MERSEKPIQIQIERKDTVGAFATDAALNISKDNYVAITFFTSEPFADMHDEPKAVVTSRVYMPFSSFDRFVRMASDAVERATEDEEG